MTRVARTDRPLFEPRGKKSRLVARREEAPPSGGDAAAGGGGGGDGARAVGRALRELFGKVPSAT